MSDTEARKAYRLQWQRDNREKCREYSRRYVAKNPDKERARQREVKRRERDDPDRRQILAARNKRWREVNGDYVKTKSKEWREANPDHGKKRYASVQYRTHTLSKNKEWRHRNPGKMAQYAFAHRLRTKGITEADFQNMLLKQAGACAACKRIPSGESRHKRLNIDHCHKTGTVRGLLCTSCNLALGYVQDSIDHLNNLIEYLRKSRGAA